MGDQRTITRSPETLGEAVGAQAAIIQVAERRSALNRAADARAAPAPTAGLRRTPTGPTGPGGVPFGPAAARPWLAPASRPLTGLRRSLALGLADVALLWLRAVAVLILLSPALVAATLLLG